MAKKPFDLLVYIGRFQPFHNGHRDIIEEALDKADRVLILIGSSNSGRTIRNPFTFRERFRMIDGAFSDVESHRLIIQPINDYPYNEPRWIKEVQATVRHTLEEGRIGLIGRNKDNSSYYLKLFPQWESVAADSSHPLVNATDIRSTFFRLGTVWRQNVPQVTMEFLEIFRDENPAHKEIRDEIMFIQEHYTDKWAGSPYTPIFVTLDTVIHQAGHILTIERKHRPGKGLIALPGGYLEPDETLLQGALRELVEETGLRLSHDEALGTLRHYQTFDHPYRDPRGRIVTHGFLFDLPPSTTLRQIKAGSDAKSTQWTPVSKLTPESMFCDHGHIVDTMLAHL